MKRIFVVLTGLLFLSHAALAAEDPKLLGTFGDWNAYTFMDGGGKVCFMSAKPSAQKGKFKKRDAVLLFITHWSADKTKDVVTVSAGYAYRPGSEATVSVDGKTFRMTTDNETAWSKDPASDGALAAAIRKGAALTVDGVSKRGTKTTDTYALKGSAEAYEAISKACDIQPTGETR